MRVNNYCQNFHSGVNYPFNKCYNFCLTTVDLYVLFQFYAVLQPFRNPYLGPSSLELYKKTYNSLQYPVKEW